jgi:PAS domain S-box-containing protein
MANTKPARKWLLLPYGAAPIVMDAIITTDYRGIIRSVNAAAERMFGYAAAEMMIGRNVTMLMASPYREAHDGYIARYLQTGEKRVIGTSREIEARRKDGSLFPVDLAVSEIEHLKLFTGIHRDLTQRRQLEREVVETASCDWTPSRWRPTSSPRPSTTPSFSKTSGSSIGTRPILPAWR